MLQFTEIQLVGALVAWVISLIVFGFFVDHFAEKEGFKKGWVAALQDVKDTKKAKKLWKKFNQKGDSRG